MYKKLDLKSNTYILIEDYPGEIKEEFETADFNAGEKVEIIHCLDKYTYKDIILYRKDYIKEN